MHSSTQSKYRGTCIIIATALFWLLQTASAGAKKDGALVEAKKLFLKGQTFFLKQEYGKAADSFLAAYAKKPYAAFLFNAAVSLEKAKKYKAAVTHFKKYLAADPKAKDAAAIRKRVAKLKKYLSTQVSRPPPRQVEEKSCEVDGDCATGEVCKNGRCKTAARPTPRPATCSKDADCAKEMTCKQGKCVAKSGRPTPRVEPRPATCSKDADCAKDMTCKQGKCVAKSGRPTPRVEPRPRPEPEPELPPLQTKGLVVIDSKPQGATIWLDSKMKPPIGKTPYQGTLPEGEYTVLVEKKGWKPEKRKIEVSSKRLLDLYFSFSREHYLGWVEVTANVPGAKVFIDDVSLGAVGRTPYSGFRKPGKHTVWVKKPGFRTVKKYIDVVSGESNTLHIKLKKVGYGWMDLSGMNVRGAKVKIDGKTVCKAPCKAVKVPAGGGRVLTVKRDGYKPLKKIVRVEKGGRTQVRAKLISEPSRVSAWVTFGFAAATLGGAIYCAVSAKSLEDDIDKDLKNNVLISNKDPRYRKGKIYAIVADGLFGVTAIAAAVGLYYMFRNPGPKSSATFKIKGVSVLPQVGPHSVALNTQLRF